MHDAFSELFLFKGRIGRGRFWSLTGLYLLALIVGVVAFVGLGIIVNTGPGGSITLVMVPIGIAFTLFMSVAIAGIGVRRLHDRGKTGFWLLLYYSLPLWTSKHAGLDTAGLAYLLVTLGVVSWAFVDLGVLRGDAESNGFGPNPFGKRLQPQTSKRRKQRAAQSGRLLTSPLFGHLSAEALFATLSDGEKCSFRSASTPPAPRSPPPAVRASTGGRSREQQQAARPRCRRPSPATDAAASACRRHRPAPGSGI